MPPDGHIRLLPNHVANKIAAGEVVERPASVLKELLENALDAGATRIEVTVTAGGRNLVSVRDNGCGMNREDALLSLERHATSKIRDVDDIERIATLGFRGEAIPSIASVSRFTLTTRREDAEERHRGRTRPRRFHRPRARPSGRRVLAEPRRTRNLPFPARRNA